MKKLICFLLAGVLLMLMGCEKDEALIEDTPNQPVDLVITPDNPDFFTGELPPSKLALKEVNLDRSITFRAEESSLKPEVLEATLFTGQTLREPKEAEIYLPPKADIMFHFDVSGSMGGEINTVKTNAGNILNTILAEIPLTQFGVTSGCDDVPGSYVYRLDQPLTTSVSGFQSGLSAVNIVGGAYEDYGYQLWQQVHDVNIGWRGQGVQKIVIAFLDEYIYAGHPYQDKTVQEAIDELKANDVVLIVVFSGYPAYFNDWNDMALQTGGRAFQTDEWGVPPGGDDIATWILNNIIEVLANINEAKLSVVTPGFEYWMTACDPPSYLNFNSNELEEPLDFTIDLTAPMKTGLYEFEVGLIVDEVCFARQAVTINVINAFMDVKPGSCPNPLNRNDKGVIPIAILGTADVDVSMIDPATINIGGVPPLKWSLEDVATPYDPGPDGFTDRMQCTTEGPDAMMDLVLHFSVPEIAALFAGAKKGDVVVLELEGQIQEDGPTFRAYDVMFIVK